MHPQHFLTLLSNPSYGAGFFLCNMCREIGRRFVYNCSLCQFDVDMICVSTSHAIEDKCHQHPLIPLQLPISFPCHICRTNEEGISYRCNICQFWVHQNCTISLPSTINHSYHHHLLTLLQFVPLEYEKFSRNCDICYDRLFSFHCVYYCGRCMFFAHVRCARSEEALSLLRQRDQNIEFNQDLQRDSPRFALLPVQQKTTDFISWFAENYSDRDAMTNLILGFDESYIDRDTNIKKEINFFNHKHPLIPTDEQVNELICDSCALPLSTPSYGCIDCGYFLHKYCTELPKYICHPAHPQHQFRLRPADGFFWCDYCDQFSNGFVYKCIECADHVIDIKCASLLRRMKHEAHQHPLIQRFTSSSTCSACGRQDLLNCILQCNTCSFNLCFRCAMAPPVMKHRYDEHPFMLTYSPPENHYNEYICDLCEKDLNPKEWFYHCRVCDQFTHTYCMLRRGADLNIKYGKRYMYIHHEHNLTLVSCTYSSSFCNKCHFPMRTGYSVGLECTFCDFKIHLRCALGKPTSLPN